MKTKLVLLLAVFMVTVLGSCAYFESIFANPLVGKWRIDRVIDQETEILIFTETTFDQTITHNDTLSVTRFTGTYAWDDYSITFTYLTRNDRPYDFLNIIKYSFEGDQLSLCWDYDDLYTKIPD